MIPLIFKILRKGFNLLKINWIYSTYAKCLLFLNGAILGAGLNANGFIRVIITRRGKVNIGDGFAFNSGSSHNIIGRQQSTILWVDGTLRIGNNVGMSSTAIICNFEIEIEDNVMIGGGTVIYDTDFHSLDANVRLNKQLDKQKAKKAKVIIKRNAFIGAHSTILKGVTIGENSIVGACSVVSKSIPSNEIWSGNPIQFIRRLDS